MPHQRFPGFDLKFKNIAGKGDYPQRVECGRLRAMAYSICKIFTAFWGFGLLSGVSVCNEESPRFSLDTVTFLAIRIVHWSSELCTNRPGFVFPDH